MKTEHAEDAGPLDEAALVTVAQHDRVAFGPLYERYVDSIYRYVYGRLGNHAEAEDVTARTFQQALAALPEFEHNNASFGAWLAAIARDQIAQRGPVDANGAMLDEQSNESPEPVAGDPVWPVTDDDAADLLTALRQLPLDQQRAIVLKFARGQTSREIGATLNRSEGAVRQLILRALSTLQAALESE